MKVHFAPLALPEVSPDECIYDLFDAIIDKYPNISEIVLSYKEYRQANRQRPTRGGTARADEVYLPYTRTGYRDISIKWSPKKEENS